MQKILITGGTGLIGSKLTHLLRERNHQVVHLSRRPAKGDIPTFLWDVEGRKIDPRAFDGITTIVHLAGENVGGGRWTKERKQQILESRTHSTRLLFEQLENHRGTVTSFISASAIGYYGFDNEEKVYREDDPPSNDFLADVVKKWEGEVDRIAGLGIRVVKVRVGIVLAREGGALKEISKPVKLYAGAPLGSGKQMTSWIHIDDVCDVFVKAVEDVSLEGALNAVAPTPVSNRELTKTIAEALGKPVFLPPVPEIILKLILGEMAEIVVRGSRVSNEKLVKAGFQYKFPTLESAVHDLLGT